jgi:hypothetical protein
MIWFMPLGGETWSISGRLTTMPGVERSWDTYDKNAREEEFHVFQRKSQALNPEIFQ